MNSTAAGSTLWQTIFVSFAIVLLLFEIVRGYRLGLPRQLMRGAAVIAAYAAAYFGGKLMLPLLRPVLKWPDFIVSMIGGALLAIVVYGVIASLGSLLFKRTAQHPSGAVRLRRTRRFPSAPRAAERNFPANRPETPAPLAPLRAK